MHDMMSIPPPSSFPPSLSSLRTGKVSNKRRLAHYAKAKTKEEKATKDKKVRGIEMRVTKSTNSKNQLLITQQRQAGKQAKKEFKSSAFTHDRTSLLMTTTIIIIIVMMP